MPIVRSKDILEAVANDEDATKYRYFVEHLGVPVDRRFYEAAEGTAAHIAAKYGNLSIVKYALEKNPSILVARDDARNTIFFTAIENGQIDIVKYLVENHGVKIFERDDRTNGNTPIHHAAEHGQLAIITYFLEEKNGDVDIINGFKQPPVFYAALRKHYPVIAYLVEERKADLTLTDHKDNNILFMAVNADDLSIIKYVLDKRMANLDVDHQNILSDTLLSRAAFLDRYEIVQYLVSEKDANVNLADEWGKTALHSAARGNNFRIVRYLIKNGADPEMRGVDGKLPADETTRQRLKQFLEKATKTRERRSVPLSPSQSIAQAPTRIREITENSLWKANSLEGRDSVRFDGTASHIHSFLVMANLINSAKLSRSQCAQRDDVFISAREVLESRMDPIAIHASGKLFIRK